MPQLELRVGSGGDADDDINVQNGNIYFLKQIYNLPFFNSLYQLIDVNHITMIPDVEPHGEYMTYFDNLNNNTTAEILVNIPEQSLNNTIAELNTFKASHQAEHPDVNFFQIVGQEVTDDTPLNVESLLKAIESIWFRFNSDLIYENIPNNTVNQSDGHPYVNSAYDEYMGFYDDQDGNGNLCYIHPHLFPLIFYYVFRNNVIPMSLYEASLPSNNAEIYNNTILQHNLQYIQNQNTILCIYRNPVVPPIMNLQAIQHNYQNNNMSISSMPTA